MMTLLRYSLLLLLFAPSVAAQDDAYVRALEQALANEDTTSTLETMLVAITAFERIAERYPARWEAPYWAAHLYGQAARLEDMDQNDESLVHHDKAQAYFDQAWAAWSARPERTAVEESDFYVLQSLLYGLRSSYYIRHGEQEQARVLFALDGEYMLRAAIANSNNPRIYMSRGIDLIRHEATREEGRRILHEAIQKYAAHPPATSIAPNWGRPWIDFWLSRYES
ncbi:MAG: hypothetical protein HKN04_13985 [Rhodothermaceae bacterium]|nr:hypothetical protein [Rhodothermaceae bacterium]